MLPVLDCVLDTGTPVTIIHTAITDELGYGAHMAMGFKVLWGVGGRQRAYQLSVSRIETMDMSLGSVEVLSHDLPERFGVEGLIGMDMLRGRILTLDCLSGRIVLAP